MLASMPRIGDENDHIDLNQQLFMRGAERTSADAETEKHFTNIIAVTRFGNRNIIILLYSAGRRKIISFIVVGWNQVEYEEQTYS